MIAGRIRINLLGIELLTIRLRLIVCSVERVKEMGTGWWETDPALSSNARRDEPSRENAGTRARLADLDDGGHRREPERSIVRGRAREEPS